jgi:hypothetical protein
MDCAVGGSIAGLPECQEDDDVGKKAAMDLGFGVAVEQGRGEIR